MATTASVNPQPAVRRLPGLWAFNFCICPPIASEPDPQH